MEGKNVLIVYAHQEPRSFVGALKDVAKETLEGEGHKVTVSDLYEMRFDASASKSSFKEIHNKEHFNFQHELGKAAENGCLPDDAAQEIEKIQSADLLILNFPMYWLGLPAILKGWVDRCFAEKVCFDIIESKWFDHGPFSNKKLMLCFTTGGTREYFSNKSIFGDMDVLLWPIQNMFRFTGFQVMAPQICYAPGDVTADERACMLTKWRNRLHHIWTEDPLQFIHIDNFDKETGFQLKDGYLDSVGGEKFSPSPGQNLGRAFKAGCMTGESRPNVQ